jgi:hypothetical protein
LIPMVPLFVDPAPLRTAPQRASDADRDIAIDILCAAVADGRLTLAELEERTQAALSARTLTDLAALISDLHPVNGTDVRPVSRADAYLASRGTATPRWRQARDARNEGRATRECGVFRRPGDDRDGTAIRWALIRSLLPAN